MLLSIIIPVYFNEKNLIPLYDDLRRKVLDVAEFECEIVMIDDGSRDGSFEVMKHLAGIDSRVKPIRLSRNFGSHAAALCGLENCSGDCAVLKSADLQEPSELILEMVGEWQGGNNVVLAVRSEREESLGQTFFANAYYWMIRRTSFPNMPRNGFDAYLIDRKVINVLTSLDERNSALTGQILWSGFKTTSVGYVRKAREIGTSQWTLAKKVRLVADSLFSFSTVPVKLVESIGALSFFIGLIWAIFVLIGRVLGEIQVEGWTTLFIFSLLSFGIMMVTLGILGEYLWRTFDASRSRPPYIIEDDLTGNS